MSKVISFRLDQDNPREAKALAVLQDSLSKGFSTRHTLTEALVCLVSTNSKVDDNKTLSELSDQIVELLENIEGGSFRVIANDGNLLKDNLSEGFMSSITLAAKPGLNYSEKEG